MSIDNQVSIGVESIQKIIKELDEISVLCSEPYLKIKIDELQNFVSSFIILESKSSVEDKIFEKMVEVKNSSPELHLKLYMLYRNLVCGRISKEDALISFESSLSLFPPDVMVY
ncbi:hypothetical protein LL033_19155 [Clostridium estertheticum]|uniref:hypothetical protein n=1 Tax=Clostridium estertheticum TaxID=238834 RepID=UPI001C0CE264|nr:hypothetical protein [Clostridium estertheticum]MBU3214274.1 hypothetical protein [Clostridium estertheticum]MBW9151952.1 hypothetical protein [Clostridium estertheticum]WAG54711.1 hypothetical protein LL033_19155 [Clostridium estertheticum]WLC85311.1 hypothetical protein KTC97_06015 [Clostridium estertheticum]